MKKIMAASLITLLTPSGVAAMQAATGTTTAQKSEMKTEAKSEAKSKAKGVFRATKEQVTKAQTMLKDKGFYKGEATGKLDPATREALKKYQESEKIKATGTLNRETVEKMGIELTEKQKSM